MRQKEYSLTAQKFLTDGELAHLEMVLDRTLFIIGVITGADFRNALVLKLLVHTGARVTEVLNLVKSDLNLESKSVLIHGLKGSRDREIPLPKKLFDLLKTYASTIEGDLIFPIDYDTIRNAWVFYRPVKKKLHSLRHSCALRVYGKTKDIKIVSTLLGHKAIQNSNIYLSYHHNSDELRKALGIK